MQLMESRTPGQQTVRGRINVSSEERLMVDPKRLDDSFLDKDGINQQLFPLLKSDLAVKRFTEFDQKVAFKAGGKHSATNIVIAFPGYFEWLAFFDPSPANAPIAAKVAAFRRAVSDTADRITKMLNAIFLSSLSGAALFREISRKPENMLTVRPTYSKSDDSDDDHPDRQTETEGDLAVVSDDDDEDNAANGIGANTTVFVGELMLSPTGVVSKFASSLIAGEPADESLFHELVHAASMLSGTMRDQKTRTARTRRHDRFNVDDESEFLAVQITNIFRQEKNRKGLRFNHDSDEFAGPGVLDAFPHMVPPPRRIVSEFLNLQHVFFDALANIPAFKAKSNVMREFKDEVSARRRG
jgi:Effector protein